MKNLLPISTMILAIAPLGAQSPAMPPEPPEPAMLFALRGAAMGGQSYLGVGVAELDSNRGHELKLKGTHGVEITRMEDESAAAKAGMKVGDVVLDYNGQRVEGMEQFVRLVRETPVGREVKLLISRNGATQAIPVVMGSRKSSVVAGHGSDTWFEMPNVPMPDIPRVFTTWSSSMLGIEAEALTKQLAEYFGVKEGVLVRSVIRDSAAEKAGIKAGDILVKIDQTAVTTPGEVTSAVRSARTKKTFPVELMRDKHETTVTVTMDGAQSDHVAPRARINGRSVKM